MGGGHVIKTWSSTQQTLSLSSGEAELYALTKAATQALGAMQLLSDFDIVSIGMILSDLNAAIGIVQREGLGGRTRHIQVQYLWIQQQVAQEYLMMRKVDTKENPADLMTKFLTKDDKDKMLKYMCMKALSEKDVNARSIHEVQKKTSRDDYWAKTSKNQSNGSDTGKLNKLHDVRAELSPEDFDKVLNDSIEDAAWVRVHTRSRRTLLTPMKVARGPRWAQEVGGFRVSLIKKVPGPGDGYGKTRFFMKVDQWKTQPAMIEFSFPRLSLVHFPVMRLREYERKRKG